MIQSFNVNTSTVYLSSSLMLRLCVAIFTSRLYLYYTFFRYILKGSLNLFYLGNKIESVIIVCSPYKSGKFKALR